MDINISGVVSQSLGSLEALRSALMGGDTTAEAVAEKRCIKEPAGCGKSLLDDAGNPRFNFDDRDKRDLYYREWQISGMCPECWDKMAAASEAAELEDGPIWEGNLGAEPPKLDHECDRGGQCSYAKHLRGE